MTRLFAGTPFDIPPECDLCGRLESECSCSDEEKAKVKATQEREAKRLPPEKQKARINVQKRKGGRKVTVVEGLTSEANDLPALLKALQAACGAGGTVKSKDDLLELQGNHEQSVRKTLSKMGYQV